MTDLNSPPTFLSDNLIDNLDRFDFLIHKTFERKFFFYSEVLQKKKEIEASEVSIKDILCYREFPIVVIKFYK